MKHREFVFICLLTFFYCKNFCQDYFSYGGSNYGGLNQIISNPSAAADNRLKLDVILAGVDFNFNNSWFEIKREALKNSGKTTKPSFPPSWQNTTPNVPNNLFKNYNTLGSNKARAVIFESRILLPSVLLQINAKNSIAFTWSLRQIANVDGISQQLVTLFEKELDLSVTQNNRVQNKNLAAIQMTWAEYGLTYARVLKDKNIHFIKAGITPKILQGLESAYLIVKDLDFLFSTTDTNSYFNTNFSYAHSANFNSPLKGKNPASEFYHRVAKPKLGLDLGIIYEWRPKYQKYKYKTGTNNHAWRKDLNKYKLKVGLSLVDIGRISFNKEGAYYDIDASIRRNNFPKFIELKNFNSFDSLVKKDFSAKNEATDFSVVLPIAINTQIDFSINQLFYLNLSTHITNFNRSNLYRVHNYSAICFAPRIEYYWFELSTPFTWNALSSARNKNILAGVNIRLGPVLFGSNDVKPLVKGDVAAMNFYMILKVAIPHTKIRDRDGDGVLDKKDECPEIAGEFTLRGCPDKDHDHVPDKIDACPNQPGLAKFKGCPDVDGDEIKDGDDACPGEKGSIYLRGCPDLDGDSIADKDDACPDKKGLKPFKGCPDTDKDGIVDKDDLCPTIFGLQKYKGCADTDGDQIHDGIDSCPDAAGSIENKGCPWPDSDKDGIIDKLDSCITTPGVPIYNGCPEPLIIAKEEKLIIEKAFSSLEFESGKDIIKKSSYTSLNALAELMITHKGQWKIKLSGHTDNVGAEDKNLILSEKRAKAVQNYLIKRSEEKESIIVEWFGQSKPIATNLTKQGRRKNRRVEMTIVSENY